jgi:ABC-type phosphate/phosphonate transport system ATPase subunit
MSGGIIIVGATNTGKTTYIKKIIDKVPNKQALFIYDVNNEYQKYFPYPLVEIYDFMEKTQFMRKGIFVLEEATIYLNNRSSNEYLTQLMVRKRHTDNTIILVFHSMRSVPRYIYELSNYITIFKTNDSSEMTARELKDDRLEAIMNEVKDNPDPHFYITLKIY